MVRGHVQIGGSLVVCLFVGWLAIGTATIVAATDGVGRVVVVGAILVTALLGVLRGDWRESLAVGLAGAAVAAWSVGSASGEAAPLVAALGVIVTALLAAWSRACGVLRREPLAAIDRAAQPTPADARLPLGVADEALFDRLAVHEMTRARRYERPLALLLVGIDSWPALVAERGRRESGERLAALAVRIRRLLRDVDALGVHGDGRLAVLLPETPLDGAQVVAARIEQVARQDVGLTTRIGTAIFPEDAGTVEALVCEAEAGLELARLDGVSTVERVPIGVSKA